MDFFVAHPLRQAHVHLKAQHTEDFFSKKHNGKLGQNSIQLGNYPSSCGTHMKMLISCTCAAM